MKTFAIVTLLIVNVWLAATVVRLENYHYASFLGFCSESEITIDSLHRRDICLRKVQTRTGALWHLYYALSNDY
jgi:hypothetical protein